jgi:hypothetical protein
LFHYTDIVGVMGICEERALWATDLPYLGRSSGVLECLETLASVISNDRPDGEDVGPENPAADRLMLQVPQGIYALANNYVVSFCTKDDQLSQWRCYDSDGAFSLGFSTDRLVPRRGSPYLSIFPVLYDEALQRRCIADLVRRFRSSYDHAKHQGDIEPCMRAAQRAFIEEFAGIAVRFKVRGFSDEMEWRLHYRRSAIIDRDGFNFDPRFRPKRGTAVAYVVIPLCDEDVAQDTLPIRRIVVGPREDAEACMFTTWRYLQSVERMNPDFEIDTTRIPVRI